MSFKEKSKKLQRRAKEFGYDIKLTHAQEILAYIEGLSNRHVALNKEKIINYYGTSLEYEDAELARNIMTKLFILCKTEKNIHYEKVTKMAKEKIKHTIFLYKKDNTVEKKNFLEKIKRMYREKYNE